MSAGPAQPRPGQEQIELIAQLLRQDGRGEVAQQLLARAAAPAKARPALFVAGEDKRGKSCLVNALLGKPELSPVGVEVVTSAPITFFASPQPAAQVFRYGEPQPVREEFERARELATVEGNPRNQENVRAVALGVDSPILAQLNLVDTPGVGGLESGHATLTLQSLQWADALLFVTEAGAQLRAEELSFLRRASARVETVILVLTKTDTHRGWRTILDDDRAILQAQAPRFASAPIVPVSSLLALRGLAADDPEDAALLREESGLSQLETLIGERVVARASSLQLANVLRTGLGTLAAVELGLRETIAASGPDDSARQALEAERSRLQALQRDRSARPQLLDAEIRKLTLERSEGASRGTVEMRRRYDQRLRDIKRKEFDELPGELVADLTALAGRLNEEAAERLKALVVQLVADLDAAAGLTEAIEGVTTDTIREELEATSLGDYGMSANDKLSVLSSFSSGRSLGSLSTVIAGAFIAPPIGLALGLGLGGIFAFQSFRSRDQHAYVAAFSSWMAAQISQAQLTMNNTFQRQMIDVQTQIREAIQQALAEREQEITASLRKAEAVSQSELAKRTEATAVLNQRLAAVVAARTQVARFLATLASATGAAAPPAPAGQAAPAS